MVWRTTRRGTCRLRLASCTPKLLKSFLQKVSADGFQIVAEEVAQPEVLFGAEILAAAEQQPARFLEDRIAAFALQAAGFLGAHLAEGFVHVGHDVEAISGLNPQDTSRRCEPQVFPVI